MGGFKVLDGRGEEIGYVEKQTTRISSLIFLSFAEILSVVIVHILAPLLASDWFILVLMTSSKWMTSQVSTAYRRCCGLVIGC